MQNPSSCGSLVSFNGSNLLIYEFFDIKWFKTILVNYMYVRTWIPCPSADRSVDKLVDNPVDKTVDRPKIDTFFEKFREKTSNKIKFFIM